MSENTVEMFLEELNALQDKYGIYIDADYKEDWDYRWDGRYLSGIEAHVVFMNKGGYEIQDIHRDENWHYYPLYMVCD